MDAVEALKKGKKIESFLIKKPALEGSCRCLGKRARRVRASAVKLNQFTHYGRKSCRRPP